MVEFSKIPCSYALDAYQVKVVIGKLYYFDSTANLSYFLLGDVDLYYITVNVYNDPPVVMSSPQPTDPPIEVHVGATFKFTVTVTDP